MSEARSLDREAIRADQSVQNRGGAHNVPAGRPILLSAKWCNSRWRNITPSPASPRGRTLREV